MCDQSVSIQTNRVYSDLSSVIFIHNIIHNRIKQDMQEFLK
ncbi:hypothetical protein B4166_0181 [Caldibacillus thermoamylovorans]|uniref:Uncharacterized protein n=1 Tax=Caldibacillus thermoamylovorans TaxID=35841 RepID=A0ABD4A2L9_9BACI|nr:hypothetical protein B4166_0181 [Caldibacillus thermoamylovorans]KIO70749.1 hypothetical protein B4167_0166 [Caldibacillus thermoamylovorans]